MTVDPALPGEKSKKHVFIVAHSADSRRPRFKPPAASEVASKTSYEGGGGITLETRDYRATSDDAYHKVFI